MFAIIESGGKQYKVSKGTVIKVEKIDGEAGQEVSFQKILMIGGDSVLLASSDLESALVTGQIIKQDRSPKIIVFKKKRRQNYRRKAGHKQHITCVKIVDVVAG